MICPHCNYSPSPHALPPIRANREIKCPKCKLISTIEQWTTQDFRKTISHQADADTNWITGAFICGGVIIVLLISMVLIASSFSSHRPTTSLATNDSKQTAITKRQPSRDPKRSRANSPSPNKDNEANVRPETPSQATAVFKYVQDDLYPDIYAFRSFNQLDYYWNLPWQNPNLSPKERLALGIELVETKTKILVIAKISYRGVFVYEFEPTTGRNKGRRFFTTSLNVYDEIR